jgi:hypothetical protein
MLEGSYPALVQEGKLAGFQVSTNPKKPCNNVVSCIKEIPLTF